MKRLSLILMLATALTVRAEDWTLTDGTIYKSVKVLSHDDGFVTVLDADGGAKVPLKSLPPDLQKRFNFDPAKAAAAEAASAAQEKASREALAREQQTRLQPTATVITTPTAMVSAVAPAPTVSTAPAAPSLTDDQMRAINAQIDDLQADIAFMKRDIKRAKRHYDDPTSGAYEDKIVAEQKQVRDLQAQLK